MQLAKLEIMSEYQLNWEILWQLLLPNLKCFVIYEEFMLVVAKHRRTRIRMLL